MKHMDSKASTVFFQLSIERKLHELFGQFTFDELQAYIEKVYAPDFGKEGVYSYFCKHCSGSWNFKTKEERQFFERFHNATGCNFEITSVGDLEKAAGKRSKDIISKTAQTVFNKLATYKVTTAAVNGELPIVTSDTGVGEGVFEKTDDIKEEISHDSELTEVIEDAQILEEVILK